MKYFIVSNNKLKWSWQHKWIICCWLVFVLLMLVVLEVNAQQLPQEETPPERKVTSVIPYTVYEWEMWKMSQEKPMCWILVQHEGFPSGSEILAACGEDNFLLWESSKACLDEKGSVEQPLCGEIYFHLADTVTKQRELEMVYPKPSVGISLSGCEHDMQLSRCKEIPRLVITAEEPIPGEEIEVIYIVNGTKTLTCHSASCQYDLYDTGMQGIDLEFWADSSFGDSSDNGSAMVRMVQSASTKMPDNQYPYYVNLLSQQRIDGVSGGCALIWETFPSIEGAGNWLSTSVALSDLSTNVPYVYLAGSLISTRFVDAGECVNGGLESAGMANSCGMDKARNVVTDWQNRFDAMIIDSAEDTGVSAQLMKNLFARESQFWPGRYASPGEVGLGHLTVRGADTLLLWNPDFYDGFCYQYLHKDVCDLGYGNLGSYEQGVLQGAVLREANVACDDCIYNIDLKKADYSVDLFAETLLANCEQTGRIIENVTGKEPSQTSSYEDLWKLTLVNYNAGSGCLAEAVEQAKEDHQPLTWDVLSKYLNYRPCNSGLIYVDEVVGSVKRY